MYIIRICIKQKLYSLDNILCCLPSRHILTMSAHRVLATLEYSHSGTYVHFFPEPLPLDTGCTKRCRHGGCVGTEGNCFGVCYCYGVRMVNISTSVCFTRVVNDCLHTLVINSRSGICVSRSLQTF